MVRLYTILNGFFIALAFIIVSKPMLAFQAGFLRLDAVLVETPLSSSRRQQRQTSLPFSSFYHASNTDNNDDEGYCHDDDDVEKNESCLDQQNALSKLGALLVSTTTSSIVFTNPTVANAAKPPPKLTQDQAFDALRRELYDVNGGSIAQLETAVNNQDFGSLMELSKAMDQTLRKRVLGSAKS